MLLHLSLGILSPLDVTKSIYLRHFKWTKKFNFIHLRLQPVNCDRAKFLIHSPTANTLFSSVSNGTGFPDCSINFHSPVTPIWIFRLMPFDHAHKCTLIYFTTIRRAQPTQLLSSSSFSSLLWQRLLAQFDSCMWHFSWIGWEKAAIVVLR